MRDVGSLLFAIALFAPFAALATADRIAVLELRNGAELTEDEASYLTNLVRAAALSSLPQTRFSVMTRENTLQLLGPDSDIAECARGNCEVEIGRRLGAHFIVSGETLRFGGKLKVSLMLHDTRSAKLLATARASSNNVGGLETPLIREARMLFGVLVDGAFGSVEPEAPVVPGKGTVVVHSQPAGAWITVNDQSHGKAPARLSGLDTGRYTVRCRLPDHVDHVETVAVHDGGESVVRCALPLRDLVREERASKNRWGTVSLIAGLVATGAAGYAYSKAGEKEEHADAAYAGYRLAPTQDKANAHKSDLDDAIDAQNRNMAFAITGGVIAASSIGYAIYALATRPETSNIATRMNRADRDVVFALGVRGISFEGRF